jgi:hypothetical protein
MGWRPLLGCQLRTATTPAEQDSTRSLALFYLSIWKSADSAQTFAKLYARNLPRKYSSVQKVSQSDAAPAGSGASEELYSTDEGPVLLTTRGNMVFVAESFPLPLARKLTALILDAQGNGALRTTELHREFSAPSFAPSSAADEHGGALSADLVHFFANCGVMKAAVDAELRAVR